MGHQPCEVMCTAISGDNPAWTNTGLQPQDIRKVFNKHPCLPCILAKRNLDPLQPTTPKLTRTYQPGECISCDVIPSITPKSFNNDIAVFVFTDIATGYIHAIPTRTKSSEALIEALETQVFRFYQRHGYTPRYFRSDSENNLISEQVDRYLATKGIAEPQSSAPYRHNQNAVERHIQTIVKGTSALLHAQTWIQADGWAEALRCYQQLRNRTPNHKTAPSSPHQLITKTNTNLSNTFKHAFGDIVAVGVPKEQREWKLDLRNDIGIYVGQTEGSVDTYRIYYPHKHKVLDRASVSRIQVDEIELQKWLYRKTSNKTYLPFQEIKDAMVSFFPIEDNNDNTISITNTNSSPTPSTPIHPPLHLQHKMQINTTPTTSIPILPTETDPLPQLNIPLDIPDDFQPSILAAAARIRTEDTPTIKRAMQSNYAERWREAIQAEVNYLFQETLRPINPQDLPPHYTIIHTTTQLKLKRSNIDGQPSKFKARTCAQGQHIHLPDNLKTSPTVASLTFNTIFQISIKKKMQRITVDTVAAFLQQDYPYKTRPVIIKLEKQIADIMGLDPNQLYMLHKYIYGLPDSGKAYYEAQSTLLISNGYHRSQLDSCLFYLNDKDDYIFIMLHVDDAFVTATNQQLLEQYLNVMRSTFPITVDYDADSYLGIHIEQVSDTTVKLTQPKLLNKIFQEFTESNCPTPPNVITPMKAPQPPTANSSSIHFIEPNIYLHLLGMLLYLTKSRPDILTATTFAATKSKNPSQQDYHNLLHIVQYLRQTKDRGLILTNDNSPFFQLHCYVDASYLIHPDSKSHTGYSITFGDSGTFYAKSLKQTLVATSSTHAETRALYTLVQDIVYILTLCNEISIPITLPAIIFEDNNPVKLLSMSQAKGMKRCKHFLMLLAYIKEQVELGLINIHKIHSKHNPADLLSKPIYASDFRYKSSLLLGETRLPPTEQTINTTTSTTDSRKA